MKLTSLFAILILAATVLTSGADAQNNMKSWQIATAQKLADNQTYPRSALANEVEGRAMVKIKVAKDGSILEHSLMESTGSEVLDREVPKVMQRVGSLPKLPIDRDHVSIVIPLVWSLG